VRRPKRKERETGKIEVKNEKGGCKPPDWQQAQFLQVYRD